MYTDEGRVAQSVQRLATGWTVQGSNRGGGEIFRTYPDRPWGPPSPLYNGYRVFPGGKDRPGRDADPSLPSSAVVKKGQSYISTPPMGRTACAEPQCLYRGVLMYTDNKPNAFYAQRWGRKLKMQLKNGQNYIYQLHCLRNPRVLYETSGFHGTQLDTNGLDNSYTNQFRL